MKADDYLLVPNLGEDIISRLIEMGKKPEELAIQNTKLMFRHTHNGEYTLIDEYGSDKGIELYWDMYQPFIENGFKIAMEKLGIKEVKDIKTFAKVSEEALKLWALLVKTVKVSDDGMVQEVSFCPNPVYGSRPEVPYLDQARYYEVEGPIITTRMLDYWLKMSGLAEKYKARLGKAMCLGYDVCEYIIERKK